MWNRLRRWAVAAATALAAAVLVEALWWPTPLWVHAAVALRDLVGASLGWDVHRVNHDTISAWGPIVLLALALSPVAFLLWHGLARLMPARQLLLSQQWALLLASWVSVVVAGRTIGNWWVVLTLLLSVLLLVARQRRTDARGGIAWHLVAGLVGWCYLSATYANPWYRAIVMIAILLALGDVAVSLQDRGDDEA
jgi:hypothetical protein